MKGFKSTGLILCGALTLAGCGGGGGDSATPVALTEQNASDAAGTTYSATSVAAASSDWGSEMLSAAAVGTSSGRFMLADFAKEQLDKVIQNSSQFTSNTVRAAAVTTYSDTCTAGGSASISFDDADNSGRPSTGDSFTVTFYNCAETVGTTINGSLALTGITFSDPNYYPYSKGASLSFNITVNIGGETLSIKGPYAFSVSTNDDVTFTTTVSSSGLTLARTGTISQTTTLSNYSATRTVNKSTWAYSFTTSGTINDSRLAGLITFATDPLAPFTGVDPYYPNAGVMTISGKNNSSVTLTAWSDGIHVQLDIDANGDGYVELEKQIITTWDVLDR